MSDLHGSPRHYERLVSLVEERRPDLVVLGGDLFADERTLDPARAGREQPRFVLGPFREWMSRMFDASPGMQVGLVFGNHDWLPAARAAESLQARMPLHVLDRWTRQQDGSSVGAASVSAATACGGAAVDSGDAMHSAGNSPNAGGAEATRVGRHWLIGYSCTPPTPWTVKDFERLDRPTDAVPQRGGMRWNERIGMAVASSPELLFRGDGTMESELERAPRPAGPLVLVSHCPPRATALDVAHDRRPLGSVAVRAAIDRLRPVVSLHGHIHESPRMSGQSFQRLGGTLAVNAGRASEYLLAAMISLDTDEPAIEPIAAELAK